MAAEAAATAARSAREAAEAGILEARVAGRSRRSRRSGLPIRSRLAFEYRLDGDATDRPFLVEAMWHDGQFTYLRSHARRSRRPSTSSGTANRRSSPTTSAEDGLYIARHVLDDGWLQVGDEAGQLAVRAAGSASDEPLEAVGLGRRKARSRAGS